MNDIIHLHNIFPILEEKSYKREELLEILEEKFGKGIKFKNCGDVEFNFDEVLKFMVSKGKIQIEDNLISLSKGCSCSH